MKPSLILQLVIGAALSGCTVNHQNIRVVDNTQQHYSSTEVQSKHDHKSVDKPTKRRVEETPKAPIAKGCEKYTPPVIGKPIRADLEALKEASSEKEVRAVLLKNISDLNKQINDYAIIQARHYNAWLKKCKSEE